MNNTLKIIGITIVVLAVLAVVIIKFAFSGSPATEPSPTYTSPNNTYSTTISVGTTSYSGSATAPATELEIITAYDGRLLQVKKFTTHLVAVADSDKVIHKYLDYPQGVVATSSLPYVIEYFDTNTSFIVYLLQEPIKQIRNDAEQYLLGLLGLSQEDLCQLRYSVSVSYEFNPIYAGKSLGFSFCLGAVVLP